MPKVQRHCIMKRAGMDGKVNMSKECSLAMKETLGLSWRQDRTQCMEFKSLMLCKHHFNTNGSALFKLVTKLIRDRSNIARCKMLCSFDEVMSFGEFVR